jgi:hypothetical protein
MHSQYPTKYREDVTYDVLQVVLQFRDLLKPRYVSRRLLGT